MVVSNNSISGCFRCWLGSRPTQSSSRRSSRAPPEGVILFVGNPTKNRHTGSKPSSSTTMNSCMVLFRWNVRPITTTYAHQTSTRESSCSIATSPTRGQYSAIRPQHPRKDAIHDASAWWRPGKRKTRCHACPSAPFPHPSSWTSETKHICEFCLTYLKQIHLYHKQYISTTNNRQNTYKIMWDEISAANSIR